MQPFDDDTEMPTGLDWWLAVVRSHPRLTTAQYAAICERIRGGDESARYELIAPNLRMAVNYAKRYQGTKMSMDDLVGMANEGLTVAAQTFDPDRSAFSTHARQWIRQRLNIGARREALPIRLPSYLYDLKWDVRQAIGRLHMALGREPTASEIAAEINTCEDRVHTILRYESAVTVSLDIEPYDGLPIQDVIPNPADDLRDFEAHDAISSRLDPLLELLDARSAEVIRRSWGLAPYHAPQTFEQIAASMQSRLTGKHISKQRAQQIHAAALETMQDAARGYQHAV